jgi:hypothetical protein
MTYRATGANNPALKDVQFATFLIQTNNTTLVVNRHQMVGRYPTFSDAKLALEGILIKNGSNNSASTRLIALKKDLIYLDSGFITTPSPVINYADTSVNYDDTVYVHTGSSQQFQSITSPILLEITSSSSEVQVFAKSGSGLVSTNGSVMPQNDGYIRVDGTVPFMVEPASPYVRLKGYYTGGLENIGINGTFNLATSTITVKNKTTNTVLDTFVITVVETNTIGI